MEIPVPPTSELVERVYQFALPAAGGAAFVVCLFSLFGKRTGALGSAFAIIAAFCWANFGLPEPVPEWERTADMKFAWETTGRPLPWTPSVERPQAYHWLPRAALTLVIVGLLSRGLGKLVTQRPWLSHLLVWLPRLIAVAIVAHWLIADRWIEKRGSWLPYPLAAAMLLQWLVLDGVSRARAGGRVAAFVALFFLTASVLLVYHQWPKPAEIAIILGFAMLGVAVATQAVKTDASGAMPAAVAFLPALMLAGWEQQDSQIPITAFFLTALAPLALFPFLIPRLNRQHGYWALFAQIIVVLIPVAIAIALTVRRQPAPF